MIYTLTSAIFYIIPILIIASFITSLVMYFVAKNKNKKNPDTFTPSQIYARKVFLTASSIVFGLMAVIVVCFCALLYMAVAYM